jgi:rhodanese-related sulfurtransferase
MYKKIIGFLCIAVLILSTSACFQKKKEGLFLVNVLDAEYYNDCHIKAPNSIQVSLENLDAFAATLDPQKSEVVFYCSNYMCTASGFAAKSFVDKGFEHVWAYEAGIADWYQKGLPVEGPCEKPYLKKKNEKIELEESLEIRILSTDELADKVKKA